MMATVSLLTIIIMGLFSPFLPDFLMWILWLVKVGTRELNVFRLAGYRGSILKDPVMGHIGGRVDLKAVIDLFGVHVCLLYAF